jgi:hypothetical protein
VSGELHSAVYVSSQVRCTYLLTNLNGYSQFNPFNPLMQNLMGIPIAMGGMLWLQ